MTKDRFGFSTGALEKSDFNAAVSWMQKHHIPCIELSALRFDELLPLVESLDSLATHDFSYVSFHAPSSFAADQEEIVISLLTKVFRRGWNIVVHPDVVYSPDNWLQFGDQLLIENMDRRKSTGRTVEELSVLFEMLPSARLCLDLAHARQLDTTLSVLGEITSTFKNKIAEVHISELDSRCQHRPLSEGAITDYRQFASTLKGLPVIIESMLDPTYHQLREDEIELARRALSIRECVIENVATCDR